jgi:hypothetical protein
MFDAFILVPEITRGMKSIGSKALLKIKQSSAVLDYQIMQLNTIKGLETIHIGTGFESEKIKKNTNKYSNINIIFNEEYKTTNQTASLLLYLQQNKPKNILIISSGVLFKNLFHRCEHNNHSKIYMIDKPKNNFNIGCHDTERIQYLFYDFPIVWSECVYFNEETMSRLQHLSDKKNLNQNYLFETINILLNENLSFDKVFVDKKNILKISSLKDIPKAKLFV